MCWTNESITDIKEIEETVSESTEKYNAKTVFFAFIDVLGFRQFYDDNKKSGTPTPPPYADVFSYFFDLMNAGFEEASHEMWYAGQTSDTLYFYTARPDYLMKFIKLYAAFSLYAMSKNVFFRGGIASGDLWINKEYQFFGESVIKAFCLEENISKYPIVTIDSSTVNAIQDEDSFEELIQENKQNKRWNISPFALWNTYERLDINDNTLIKPLDRDSISTNIDENFNNFEYDDKNRSKYKYLHDELNEVLKRED